MKISQSLNTLTNKLSSADIKDARIEAEVLLRNVLNIDRTELYASLAQELAPSYEEKLEFLVTKRLSHVPLAYITGHREFYGLDLIVNPNVLIPRQETELLVDKALEFCSSLGPDAQPKIADIGTGSGAIAIAIANKVSNATVFATDVSKPALSTANLNLKKYRLTERVYLCLGDLCDALPTQVDLVVSNLPYIPTNEINNLSPEIHHEPNSSLDGGKDGLDLIKRMIDQIPRYLRPAGRGFIEISPVQLNSINKFTQTPASKVQTSFHRDLIGLPRVVEMVLGKDVVNDSVSIEKQLNA